MFKILTKRRYLDIVAYQNLYRELEVKVNKLKSYVDDRDKKFVGFGLTGVRHRQLIDDLREILGEE